MSLLQRLRVVACPRLLALVLSIGALPAYSAEYPAPAEHDVTLRDFHFTTGEVLPELRIHYRTLGSPKRDARGIVRNAVLIGHGTGGTGAQFIRPEFAGELFGKGQLLDATKYFIVLPDGIGHGQSSKPSDGLRAKFPQYGYTDMVEAEYRLLTEGLGVNHLRLVMGTSMGGMHTWVWGERHPDFMDALMPLASLPWQISGRNRVWRKTIIDAIRHDPAWQGGNYTAQPPSLRTAAALIFFMGSNPILRQEQMPSLKKSDEVLEEAMDKAMHEQDANDVLYQVGASWDYDPNPGLERIRAPLYAVNSADDLINPPELGILEREITRVKEGRAVVVPSSKDTRGHGTHTMAAVWKQYLAELLKTSEKIDASQVQAIDAFSHAAKLGALDVSRPEIRIWIAPVTLANIFGIVISPAGVTSCDERWQGDSVHAVRGCRPIAGARPQDALALLGDLSKLDGRKIDCGGLDGDALYIEAAGSGRRVMLSAVNPEDCKDATAALLGNLLRIARGT